MRVPPNNYLCTLSVSRQVARILKLICVRCRERGHVARARERVQRHQGKWHRRVLLTCRRRVPERPRRENQRQRSMSALKELRQNEYERQRRDFTGKRLKKHNDARDLVSDKKTKQTPMFSKRQCSCHSKVS